MARPTSVPVHLTQDAPTRFQGQVLTIRPFEAANPTRHVVKLPGGNPPRHRKYIRITNEDTGNGSTTLYLVAGNEQSIDPTAITVAVARIAPGEFIELWTNATLFLKNITSGETVTPVHVMELFYT